MRTYLAEDCLKPQYDGMTMWEIAGKVMEVMEHDEKPHLPAPTDEEMHEMYDAIVGAENKEYQNAH